VGKSSQGVEGVLAITPLSAGFNRNLFGCIPLASHSPEDAVDRFGPLPFARGRPDARALHFARCREYARLTLAEARKPLRLTRP
jgi:hypothetical protein